MLLAGTICNRADMNPECYTFWKPYTRLIWYAEVNGATIR